MKEVEKPIDPQISNSTARQARCRPCKKVDNSSLIAAPDKPKRDGQSLSRCETLTWPGALGTDCGGAINGKQWHR